VCDAHTCTPPPGLPCVCPAASSTSTGSTSKGCWQYSENMHTTVLSTVLALVRSVAVHSMNTSRVFNVICTYTRDTQARLGEHHGKPLPQCACLQPVGASKPFPVPSVLTAECDPLMMGGRESTTLLASYMTGYTTEFLMMGTNFLSF
jgi:hypothetical protein